MGEQNPAPIIITPDPVKIRLSPLGFQTWAKQFLKAAQAIEDTDEFFPVRYFLTCRTIELALKAYLLARGCSRKELKDKIRHDLCRALKKAQGESLAEVVELSDAEREAVNKANVPYNSKRFEYFEVVDAMRGFPDRPDAALLLGVAEKLAIGVQATCEASVNTT